MSGRMVLVVEDDAPARDELAALLAGHGYHIVSAGNGQEALDYLHGHASPNLILLNLVMPGMNGWEFRDHQQRDPALTAIPVVVLSCVGRVAARADGLGDVGYLQKPVEAGALLAAVERFSAPKKPCLLVVEDEPALLKMLGVALRHHGFTVFLAANGAAAVELYGQHRDAIDLVLSDVQMGGLDGPQTLAALRGVNPDVRCCFMSGHPGRYMAQELLGMGAAQLFEKPFSSLTEVARVLWQVATR